MPTPQEPHALDEEFFADPHASYASLRQAGSVHRAVSPDGAPLVLVTGYSDVREAVMDPRLSLCKQHASTTGRHGASMPPELDRHLLNTDPADHARLRRLAATAFTARRTELLREGVQRTTDRLLDQMAQRGRGDVVADLAMPLSMEVISNLLGVPEDDRPDFRAWTNTLQSPKPDNAQQSQRAMREMHGFLIALIAGKRAAPTDDLLSALIAAHEDEDRLSAEELVAMAFLLLFGGYHNTASLISTTAMALLTHPDHLTAFRDGELPIRAVTEEVLRWNSPTMLACRRFPTEGMEIGDAALTPGERVWMSWISANRDPERFAQPEVFDPHREDNAHLAFGHGAHYCPGAALARLETDVAVTSLVQRFPGLSLSGAAQDLQWVVSPRTRCLQELPVSL
ncbi:cytochrome P450 family protein [Streptomyces sp. 8N706]|uniref:cytochrome P450 family protein n=1 Tax=Streptomyces sp. 8N706 TaxID=3457416 RepID=UPI003FCF7107